MRGFRLFWLALRDFYDSLLLYCLASIIWWIGVFLVIPGPVFTLALFHIADPRHGFESERPGWRDMAAYVRRTFVRSWGMALMTLPLVAILYSAIAFYGAVSGVLAVFQPAAIILFIICLLLAFCTFSASALTDRGAVASLRLGGYVTGRRIGTLLVAMIPLMFVLFISVPMILPLIIFGPAITVTTFNRVVLDGLGLEVGDAMEPTPERIIERQNAPRKRRWR